MVAGVWPALWESWFVAANAAAFQQLSSNLAPHFTHYISTVKRWIYQDDLVTWHRIYFLWYVIAFLVAMWTVPAPEPPWGVVINFRPVQSDCIVRADKR